MISLFIISLALMLLGGVGALLAHAVFKKAASYIAGVFLVGGLLGLIPSIFVVVTGQTLMIPMAFSFPAGAFLLQIDALSAFFLIPIFILSSLSAVYGRAYLRAQEGQAPLGQHWFLFSVFVVSMALVIVAHDAISFLVFWEIMTVVSFFLVTFDHEKPGVCQAGLLYLVLSHVGVACLFVLFIVLGGVNGMTGFAAFSVVGNTLTGTLVFMLALVGFGLKAGFIPLHIWLPKAHPAAPSHISALMSGVMIKLGIYGFVRVLSFVHCPPFWWGGVLIGTGIVSGILGVLYALTQHDLKKLLAYHSIENIGIICMGLGVGVVGLSTGNSFITALGFAGALLHTLNHALFKGLLFMGAGAIQHATGTRNIEQLGGLLHTMRSSGLAFLIGAAAICGLPPLNGFVSEFLIYAGSFYGGTTLKGIWASACLFAVITSLALIGGLAVACFTKVFGIIYLGEARSAAARHASEVSYGMRYPMAVLAWCCLIIGLIGPACIGLLAHPVAQIIPGASFDIVTNLSTYAITCQKISYIAGALLVVIVMLTILRYRMLAGQLVVTAVTWDCGYGHPTPRMQYTASSFASPAVALFSQVIRPLLLLKKTKGYFPEEGALQTTCTDLCMTMLYEPCFRFLRKSVNRLKVFQHGYTHLYILYILLILLVFMLWKVL